MLTTSQTITAEWRVRELPRDGRPEHLILPAIPAQVPGHVHLDLQRAGVIPDPFIRMNERGVEWVDATDWVYETAFDVEEPLSGRTYLVFDGVDTIAEISLNGVLLGNVDNMFIAHEFDVTDKLKPGENKLSVIIRSALRIGEERIAAWDAAGNVTKEHHWDQWSGRAFVRKAQYMYGWDWGPVLRSAGLWRGVRVVNVPQARITDWRYDVAFAADNSSAVVTFDVAIERAGDTPLELGVNLYEVTAWGDPLDVEMPDLVTVTLEPGATSAKASVTVSDPLRWWPNGTENGDYRAPHLYGVEITLFSGDEEVDEIDTRIGLRTIELLHEPDADGKGEGFKFRVNGADIFAKGANWIPSDSFASTLQNEATYPDDFDEVTDMRVTELILLARDAGMNMLRIWGGGFYESDYFYESCDVAGILVWQDFMHACSYYPDTDQYADAARVEAVASIRRIRNHPSIALWCGNNECIEMFANKWTPPPSRLLGEHLYFDIYPAAVAAEDPNTPYWPGSPWGGENPTSADFGDRHNWDVWHGRGDWKFYSEDHSRFCSEFGFGASCGLGAWDSVLEDVDKTPYSTVVKWHDKSRRGYDKYLEMVAIHFPRPQTLEDLVYYTQVNQAEALKYGIEHYRRSKGRCWGTLFWQFNDCWPVQSWAVVDSLIDPKAAYHAMKRFYAPLLLSFSSDGDMLSVHLVNDLLEPVTGQVKLTIETFSGEPLATHFLEAAVPANGAAVVGSVDLSVTRGREKDVLVYASFEGKDAPDADNFFFFAEPKEWLLPRPQLTVHIEERDGEFEVAIAAESFAPYVWLRLADNSRIFDTFDDGDNFFHLRAGETRYVYIEAREDLETVEQLRGLLTVRTL
ncbi:MAG TPA: glycoside hydrolase family 2 protein [Capsulimonadaceae bacterium]